MKHGKNKTIIFYIYIYIYIYIHIIQFTQDMKTNKPNQKI